MSTEMNFIKYKGLLSEFNEFRKTDPAYLSNIERRRKWGLENRDKLAKAQCKYAKNNREEINRKQNERYRAIAEIKKSYE